MKPISDALELLTAQHEEIEDLLAAVATTRDARVFDELAEKLVTHLATEQLLFYPLVARAMTVQVLDEVLQEHLVIKRVLAELVWLGVEDEAFAGKLERLASLLTGHCGWQEDHLFETVAESMPAETLTSLGRQMQEHVTAFPVLAAA